MSSQILWDNLLTADARFTPWIAPALSQSTFDAAENGGDLIGFAIDFGREVTADALAYANFDFGEAAPQNTYTWRFHQNLTQQSDSALAGATLTGATVLTTSPPITRLSGSAGIVPLRDAPFRSISVALQSSDGIDVSPLNREAAIGYLALGRLMTMPRGPRRGFRPRGMAREWQMHARRTVSGAYLGQTAFEKAGTAEAVFDTIPEEFVRTEWEPFRHHAAQGKPYFLNWDPEGRPEDTAYCVSDKPPPAPQLDQPGFSQLRLPITYLDLYADSLR